MSAVKARMDKTECYSCHAFWVPQCCGCHVKVDYSRDENGKQKAGIDWVASGNAKTGEVIPEKHSVQITGIPKLKFDWSQIVDRDGTQLATVGTHWPISRAFNMEELDTVMRAGTGMGCHRDMSPAELREKISTEGKFDPAKHLEMMNNMIKIMAEKGIKPAEAKP